MKYVRLGRAGVQVSRLCLGTMNFGPETSEADSFAIMDRALDAGINFFDTANVYGRKLGPGATEALIGRWFAQGGGRREKVVIATKAYGKMGNGPNDSRLSALHLRRACDDSLKRLQTDRIDLFQFHHVWRDVSWDEVWAAMEHLAAQGKVTYCGSSNFAAWHIVRACEAAKSRHFLGLVSEQSFYNLLERTIELELLPACREYGIGVIPWSPVCEGLLAGGWSKATSGRRAAEHLKKRAEKHRDRLETYERFCQERGHAPAVVAVAWLLHQPGVTAPIIGPRVMSHLEDALKAHDLVLPPDDLKRLDEIFPGPGGAAPEAYAW